MCWQCELLQIPVGSFQFPLALPAKKKDPVEERLANLEAVLGQLLGDDL